MLDVFLDRADSLADPAWLIQDLVPDAGRVLLAAAPSAGKTFLALVIGLFAATKGRVVYLVLEEGGAKATANRFRSLKFPAGAQVLVMHHAGLSLGQHTLYLAAMLERGVDGPAPVLVLDPFAAVFRGDENSTEQMAAAVSTLDLLMRADPRLLLVIPHHTSKAGERGEMGDPMHAARGGTSLPAWADMQLNLKHVSTPKGSGRIEFDALVAKNRDGERDYVVRVAIELGTGEVTMKPAGEAKHEAKSKDLRERLVAFVGAATEPLTKNRICSGVSGSKRDKLALIDELTKEGVLSNAGTGWVLAGDEEAAT
jgi:RecA-family ATPase